MPGTTTGIFRTFCEVEIAASVPALLGTAQGAVALIAGSVPRLTYGLAPVLHPVTVSVPIPRLPSPWSPISNHPFVAGLPVLAGFVALYVLRDADPWSLARCFPVGRRSAA
ncbi:hypothetical protein ACE7GA_07065 [Roseomonas sp. CCTCC AB2023176]|uniref:hypothetical protein n=1 Tax=Roseomonas sp. CCTCC AB2023176 TaxID=3342640 RepID=UPI0035DDECB5